METIDYRVEDGIAYVVLNRPEQKNALNWAMRRELCEVWALIEGDVSVSVALISGAGSAFSGGHDLKEVLSTEQKASDVDAPTLYGGLYDMSKPVVAAINGPCMAQGAGLALLADVRIASESTVFGWPQAKRGLSSTSGPALFTRLVPWNIAMEYLLTGEMLLVEEALRWGLVNRVVKNEELMTTAVNVARRISANAPLAVRGIKEASRMSQALDQHAAFDVAWRIRERVYGSADAFEGRRAFAEKRQPVWRGM